MSDPNWNVDPCLGYEFLINFGSTPNYKFQAQSCLKALLIKYFLLWNCVKMLLTLSEETRDLGSATKVEKRVRTRESERHNVRNAGTSGQHNSCGRPQRRTDGPIKSSARGPRGPKKTKQRKLCSYANKQKNLHFIIASHLYSVLLLLINAKKKH